MDTTDTARPFARYMAPANRCVLINWDQSRLRYPDETDEEWRFLKLDRDEEEYMGVELNILLAKCVDQGTPGQSIGSAPCARDFAEPVFIIGDRAGEKIWKWDCGYGGYGRWWRKLSHEEQLGYEKLGAYGQYSCRHLPLKGHIPDVPTSYVWRPATAAVNNAAGDNTAGDNTAGDDAAGDDAAGDDAAGDDAAGIATAEDATAEDATVGDATAGDEVDPDDLGTTSAQQDA